MEAKKWSQTNGCYTTSYTKLWFSCLSTLLIKQFLKGKNE